MSVNGKWDSLNEQASALAMHAALLPTGQVLYFGGNERIEQQHNGGPGPNPPHWDHTRIWTPENGHVDYVPSPGFDLFCCGHCFLSSGQLLVMGGTESFPAGAGPYHGGHGHLPGVRNATRFDPQRAGLLDQLWHNGQTSTGVGALWTDWSFFTRPANKAKHVSVATHPDGRMHAVMVGLDDQVWHNEQKAVGVSAAWTGWGVLSSTGDKAKGLAVACDGAGRLHAFAIGIGRSPWLATQQMLPERNMQPEAGGGRWYPTPLTLPDGRVVVMGGHPSKLDTRHSNFMVEIFNPQSNQWIDAGDEPLSVWNARSSLKPEIYPRLHVLPDGTVFCVVLADEKSYFWHPTQGFTLLPPSAVVPQEVRLSVDYDLNLWGSVLLPLRSTNAGYIARILVAGGMVQPYVIEPRAINPMWLPTQARQGFSGSPPVRRFASLVLLPDGTVLMVGGTQDWTDDKYAVLEAEQYDPVTNTWTKLAAAERPRQYHSAALLLPDGRVWVGGSNKTEPPPSSNNGLVREDIMEVFSPPYLFRGARPTIDSSPTDIFWNKNFLIRSQNAANITHVVLMRQGSSTHGFDADQRFVELDIQSRSVSQKTLTVKAPPDRNIAPTGNYMLFVLGTNDVPSHARMVRL